MVANPTQLGAVTVSVSAKPPTSRVLRYGMVVITFLLLGVALAKTMLRPVPSNESSGNQAAVRRSLPRMVVVDAEVPEDARPSISPDGGLIAFVMQQW